MEFERSICTPPQEIKTHSVKREPVENILPFETCFIEERGEDEEDILGKKCPDPLQSVVVSNNAIQKGLNGEMTDPIGINSLCSNALKRERDVAYKTDFISSADVGNAMKCSVPLMKNLHFNKLGNSLMQEKCVEADTNKDKELSGVQEQNTLPFEEHLIEEGRWVEESEDQNFEVDPIQSDSIEEKIDVKEGIDICPTINLNHQHNPRLSIKSVGYETKNCSVVLIDIRNMPMKTVCGSTSGSNSGSESRVGTSSCKICERTWKNIKDLKGCDVLQLCDQSANLVVSNNEVSKPNNLSKKVESGTEKMSFLCPFCNFRSSDRGLLKDHKLIHGEKPYKCYVCLSSYSSSKSLKHHLLCHVSGETFKCELCEYSTQLKHNLKTHIKRHNNEKPYACKLCDFKSKEARGVQNHMSTHENKTKNFVCEVCARAFATESRLKRHFMIHSGDQPFKCTICIAKFTSKSHLKRHMIIHSGEKPFKCDICSFTCSLKSNLRHHLKIHDKDKPFKCSMCAYRCSFKATLNEHVRIHKFEKPFKCELCFYESSFRSNLRVHLRTHTGQKPFQCDICQHSCASKSILESHITTHTGERPFKCKLCDFRGGSKSILTMHKKVHSSEVLFKCDLCDFGSKFKENLRRHLKTHSDEKPFKCDLCPYKTCTKSSLTLHSAIHSDERPFSCDFCDYRCKVKPNLLLHMRRIHAGKNC